MDNTLYYIDERRSNVVKSVLVGILLKYVLYIFGCYFKTMLYYTMLIQLNFPIFFRTGKRRRILFRRQNTTSFEPNHCSPTE